MQPTTYTTVYYYFRFFCLTSRHFRRSLQVGQDHHRNSTEPLGTASARADVVAVTGTTVSKHRRINQLQQNWHNFTKVRRVSYIVSSIMYIWFGCTTTMQATFHILLLLPLLEIWIQRTKIQKNTSQCAHLQKTAKQHGDRISLCPESRLPPDSL